MEDEVRRSANEMEDSEQIGVVHWNMLVHIMFDRPILPELLSVGEQGPKSMMYNITFNCLHFFLRKDVSNFPNNYLIEVLLLFYHTSISAEFSSRQSFVMYCPIALKFRGHWPVKKV